MNGQPLKAVQELLGHSTIQMTEVYSHLSPNVNHEAIGTLLSDPAATEKRRKVGRSLGAVEGSEPVQPPA
jgi:site-specific recombinase XerC